MMQEVILAGDDTELEITLEDKDGDPIDIDTLAGLTVVFCNQYDTRKYSIAPSGDDKNIAVVDAENGVFSVVLDRLWTLDFSGRTFDCDITTVINANGSYPDGEKHKSVFWKDFLKIEKQC